MYQLENISEIIKKDLDNSTKKIQRLKLKAVVKTMTASIILIGGVAATILFPNPLSTAVVIGAAAILSGSEGIKHTLKRLKATKFVKKQIKESNKNNEERLLLNKLREKVNEKEDGDASPSAPEWSLDLYPSLRT